MTWWIISQEGAVFFSWDSLVVCFSFDSLSVLFQNPFTQWAVVQLCHSVCLLQSWKLKPDPCVTAIHKGRERERERGLEFARQIGGIRSHYLLYHLLYLSPSWEKNVRLDCWHMFVVVSFFFLFLNPWTYIRSLLPRQLVSSDCVLLQGRVRKKEIDRLHYRLLCQNEPRSLVFEQTKHLGQVYKSVVAIYDHSTRIFSFPPFFSLFFCLTFNPVWARRSLLLLQSDQWTSVHHVEIRYPLKMSVRWSLAPHDGQRLEKLYIEMSFSTVNAARGERINRPDWKWSESLITISTSPCMRFTTYLFIGYSR
jgi:hypothetical protein